MERAFARRKEQVLAGVGGALAGSAKPDRSLKSSVDAKFREICAVLNARPDMYTTSCCSGRLSVYLDISDSRQKTKRRGFIVFAAHDESEFVDADALCALIAVKASHYAKADEKARNEILPHQLAEAPSTVDRVTVWLRFEPLLLHVKCLDLDACSWLLSRSRDAGLKEVGITTISSTKRFQCSISGSLRMSVPLLTPNTDLRPQLPALLEEARTLMRENDFRLELFLKNLGDGRRGERSAGG